MAGEGRSVRRDVLFAVLIALSVAMALVVDAGLEDRARQDLALGAPRADPRVTDPEWRN